MLVDPLPLFGNIESKPSGQLRGRVSKPASQSRACPGRRLFHGVACLSAAAPSKALDTVMTARAPTAQGQGRTKRCAHDPVPTARLRTSGCVACGPDPPSRSSVTLEARFIDARLARQLETLVGASSRRQCGSRPAASNGRAAVNRAGALPRAGAAGSKRQIHALKLAVLTGWQPDVPGPATGKLTHSAG